MVILAKLADDFFIMFSALPTRASCLSSPPHHHACHCSSEDARIVQRHPVPHLPTPSTTVYVEALATKGECGGRQLQQSLAAAAAAGGGGSCRPRRQWQAAAAADGGGGGGRWLQTAAAAAADDGGGQQRRCSERRGCGQKRWRRPAAAARASGGVGVPSRGVGASDTGGGRQLGRRRPVGAAVGSGGGERQLGWRHGAAGLGDEYSYLWGRNRKRSAVVNDMG